MAEEKMPEPSEEEAYPEYEVEEAHNDLTNEGGPVPPDADPADTDGDSKAEQQGHPGNETQPDTRPKGTNGGPAPHLYFRAFMKGQKKPLIPDLVLQVPDEAAAKGLANAVFQNAVGFLNQMQAQAQAMRGIQPINRALTDDELKRLAAMMPNAAKQTRGGLILPS